jgi:hypothetical protein
MEARAERERQRNREMANMRRRGQGVILSAGDSCVGILNDLNGILSLAGIATVTSVIGTVTGAAALISGIAKAATDKQIREIEARIRKYENMTQAQLNAEVGAMDDEQQFTLLDDIQQLLIHSREQRRKSTVLGHVRTAGMAVTTATSVTAAITSGMGASRMGDIIKAMNDCNDEVTKVRTMDAEMQSAGVDQNDSIRLAAREIMINCPGFDTGVVESIQNQLRTTTVISAVGAGVAAAGTITSAMANSKSVREGTDEAAAQKERNLNVASNIAAGVSTATSGISAILSGITGERVRSQAQIAARCEAAF